MLREDDEDDDDEDDEKEDPIARTHVVKKLR